MEAVVAMQALVAERLTPDTAALARRAGAMSARYRHELPSAAGRPLLEGAEDLAAYGLVRFPATYRAALAVTGACRDAAPSWRPRRLLDCGTGLGATLVAALTTFADLVEVTSIEQHRGAQVLAQALVDRTCDRPIEASWRTGDCRATETGGRYDLVTAGYLLNELGDDAPAVAVRLWEQTDGVLVLVEPGRPAEYRLLVDIRDRLLGLGATTLAPCPHDRPCPLTGDDWCHVAARVQRTADHRRIKQASLPFEDEKYSYVALARPGVTGTGAGARIVARPERRKGLVTLKLCRPDGVVRDEAVGRSDARYRSATHAGWGDAWPPEA